ncbi:MAG: hypothetical protein AAFR21_15620 [Pseudomonadota bacterium]
MVSRQQSSSAGQKIIFVAVVSMAIIVGAIFFANSAPKAVTAIKQEGRLEAIARIEGPVDSCRYSVSTFSRSNAAQMVAADRSTGWGDCTDARHAAERDGSAFGSVESRQSFLVAYQDENGHTVHGHWFSFTPDAFAIGDHVMITYVPEATQSLTVLRKGTERYDPDGSVVGVDDAGAASEISEDALAAGDKEKPAFDSSAYPLHVQIIGNIILITVFIGIPIGAVWTVRRLFRKAGEGGAKRKMRSTSNARISRFSAQ